MLHNHFHFLNNVNRRNKITKCNLEALFITRYITILLNTKLS